MRDRTFGSLGEFRDVIPQLASASSHNVFVDLGSRFEAFSEMAGDEPVHPKPVNKQAIWNDRDNNLSYIGTKEYTITQHADVLRTIDDALGQTVGDVDFGHVRDYGERIDGLVTFENHSIDVLDLVGEGYTPPARADMADPTLTQSEAKNDDGWVRDRLGVGMRFQNSFDGSEKLTFETVGYRFICQNWLLWGKQEIGHTEMVHISALDEEMVEELIFDVIDEREGIESQIIDSTEETFDIRAVPELLDNVGYGENYKKDITRTLQSYDIDESAVSLWDVYNATTDHLDHEVVGDVRPVVYQRHQEAATDIFLGDVGNPQQVEEFEAVYSR